MREEALGRMLLVKAVEEADRTGELLPPADREHATRTVLRSPDGAAAKELSSDARSSRVLRLLDERAELLFAPLAARYPVLREILERSRFPGWLTSITLVAAFATGIGLASLDGARRINILAFPFLGVVAWNFAVYAWFIVHAIRGTAGTSNRFAVGTGWSTKAITRRLGGIIDQTSRVHAKLGEVVTRYATDLARIGGPLLAAHARRLLHLSAAALALGMIAGLYFRGVVFRYEAGWESTFLGPRAVRAILGIVFGPASALSGIALPTTDEAVATLRWTATGGGGDAAPWIHLIAVTLGLYVVAPRALLALLALIDGWRWRRAAALPDELLGYARGTLGAAQAGQGSGDVIVVPYAYELAAVARTTLDCWVESEFGRGARTDLRPMSPYGQEDQLRSALVEAGIGNAEGVVLLLSLAATPESENHGLAIAAARDATRGAKPERTLRVVVDESGYASRLAGDASLASRMDERRRLWRDFVRGYGVDAAFVDLRAA
jgi:hypothetical protein